MRSNAHTFSRRRMLQLAGASVFGIGTPGAVAARVSSPGNSTPIKHNKSCIFILLCGGPSHLDMWDMKPAAPAEIRGPYKPIASAVPGMRISELHTSLSKLTNDFTLIRSMTHPGNISNHFDAMHNCLSGQANAPADSPYLGSILAKVRPSQRSIASYMWLIKCIGDPVFCAPNLATGGNLGAPYAPLFVGDAKNNPSMPDFRPPDALVSHETPVRSTAADNSLMDWIRVPVPARRDARVQRRGFEVATSEETRRAFDVEREDPRLRDRYGRNPLGQNLLLARRLVEAGVGFVTVNGWTGKSPNDKLGGPPSSSWDMHGSNMGMGNAFGTGSYGMSFCLPRLDAALAALLTDLKDRGMLENTLVVALGEFGRTPRIIPGANPGRQHWPHCYPAILAGGGGIKGGMVYGESDKIGAYVKDKPVRPQDLSATIFHALGIPYKSRVTKDGLTKPLSTGEAIEELFE